MGTDSLQIRDVFISYTTKDKQWADMACAVLEGHRVRCWIAPRDITPGTEWGAAILDAINSCRMMVLIFSANTNGSEHVRREVDRATGKRLTVLLFRVEDVKPAGSLEYALCTRHWLDAFTPPMERQMNRLAEAVRSLLGVDRPTDGPPPEPPRSPRSSRLRRRLIAATALLAVAVGGVIYATRDRTDTAGPKRDGPEVARHDRDEPGKSDDSTPPAATPDEPGSKPQPNSNSAPEPKRAPAATNPGDDEPVIPVGSRVRVTTSTQAFANAAGDGGRFLAAGPEGVVEEFDEERNRYGVLLDEPARDKVWIPRGVLAVVVPKK